MDIIETALADGQRALTEYQSKQLLAGYGIPVTREVLVKDADAAVDGAAGIGFPVVLKGSSPELMHKSDAGCVKLGLATPEAVREAFDRIGKSAGKALDGVLVQEMVAGQREIVIGLSRDAQFGPCVMLGTGGVLTEIINDTVFRVAPIDEIEAMDMIADLKSRAMLDAFRGQQPADLKAICSVLAAVGRIGLEKAAISEIDINPLIITPEGRVVAVDALIILDGKGSL
ncbi:MAG: acetate--CoA ligase family protein [Pseudomonadota bacterium]